MGEGRGERRQFRLVDLDPDVDYVTERRSDCCCTDITIEKRTTAFWETTASKIKLKLLIEEDRRFRFQAKAEEADRILYTRQSYREFPDLWAADPQARRTDASSRMRILRSNASTGAGPSWSSGTAPTALPLQGVLIKPGGYEPGPPVSRCWSISIVSFSQRLHEFNQPVINHRPSFPLYASNGYAVFLPDVRFEIGRPGISAVKALVPGVQKLVDMGIADPEAIGLHGHSWSGYQAAYVITQTQHLRRHRGRGARFEHDLGLQRDPAG